MEINKKTRAELKNYFKKNAIPTEGNFGDFIDAGVNQKDDGLLKPAGEPLSLEASIAGTRTAIRFYETFTGSTNPSWVVSLREPVSQQSAFVLSDALGTTRFWIGQSGVVTAPGAVTAGGALTAGSTLTAGGLITANGGLTVPAGKTLTVNGTLSAGTTTATGITVNGNLSVTGGGVLGAGTINASGLVTAGAGLTVPSGKTLSAVGPLVATGGFTASGGDIALTPTTRAGVRLDRNGAQYVGLPTMAGSMPFNTGVTIQAWIYRYSLNDDARIIELGNFFGLGGNDDIRLSISSDGRLRAVIYRSSTAGTDLQSAAGVVTPNKWIHVAMTVDGAGAMKLYKDGVVVGTAAASAGNIPNAVNRSSNYIGKGGGLSPQLFNGLIAELSVWTGERPVSLAPLVGNEAGLVGYWKLAQNAGDSCTNIPHIGNGTLSGSSVLPIFTSTFDQGQEVSVTQEDWSSPILSNGWLPYGSEWNLPGFFKDSFGVVHLRGMIKKSVAGPVTPNETLFTLPVGYRPQLRELCACASNNAFGRVDIMPSGDVDVIVGNTTYLSLDSISFRVYP